MVMAQLSRWFSVSCIETCGLRYSPSPALSTFCVRVCTCGYVFICGSIVSFFDSGGGGGGEDSGVELSYDSLYQWEKDRPFTLLSLPLPTPLILYVWAATLGYLPPPCCLSSVTLLSEAQTGPVFSSPTQLAAVSWAGTSTSETLPFPLVTGPQFGMTASGPPSPPGLVLSLAAEPIPKKIVDKIRSGQFVEMKELLTDNLSLISQLEAVQGIAPPPHARSSEAGGIITTYKVLLLPWVYGGTYL